MQVQATPFQALVSAVTVQAPAEAAKPAAPKVAKKPAGGKTVTKAKAAAPIAVAFGVHDGYRPKAGHRLYAFTHAWLSLSGMASGKPYSKQQAIKVAGRTAITYHLGAERFKEKDGMLILTPAGQAFFGEHRSNEASHVQAWVDILRTGKPDGNFIKNPDTLRKIEA